jgi:hypothetical protein
MLQVRFMNALCLPHQSFFFEAYENNLYIGSKLNRRQKVSCSNLNLSLQETTDVLYV